jgi:ribonuclease P protein component
MDQRFRPHERLRRKADFDRIFAARRSAGDALMAVHLAPNGLAWSRFGVSISKHLGNSVLRHAVRRRLREAFRRNKAALPAGFDMVCVARRGATERGCDFVDSLLKLTERAAHRARK